MSEAVDITIAVDAEAAHILESPARREAAGRYLSGLLREGRLRDVLAEAIAAVKAEAYANGLTDQDIDSELQK